MKPQTDIPAFPGLEKAAIVSSDTFRRTLARNIAQAVAHERRERHNTHMRGRCAGVVWIDTF
jgi:hypothetical protein